MSDIRTKLVLWGASAEEAKVIIELLIRDRFISNERYARMFASEKARFNKWGPKKIEMALKAKGVEKEIVELALNEVQELFTGVTLAQLLKSKMKSIKAKNDYDLKSKLLRFGISRGFSYEQVHEVVDKVINRN